VAPPPAGGRPARWLTSRPRSGPPPGGGTSRSTQGRSASVGPRVEVSLPHSRHRQRFLGRFR
jgi:hypothetical protein